MAVAVVVTLDGEVHDPSVPLLYADELAAVRGDGAFETALVRGGSVCKLEAHLDRMAVSAASMDLAEPGRAAWRSAVEIGVGQWNSLSGEDAMLRLVYTRGRESGGGATAYLTIAPVPARSLTARRDGVSVITLDRGLPAQPAEPLPWLLSGAKTLSYAINMSALRYAETQGAQDVIFVSSDGFVLEGPRSTVIVDTGDALVTPFPEHGILHGTTQRALFEVAAAEGIQCRYQAVRPADLTAAQDVWMLASITLAARVHTLDGVGRPAGPLAARLPELVDKAIAL
ncbi:aminodeoxychorismate lyase [Mycobacteroides abscessus]|uniref:aminodeoxychorismate lyase n=1 Tax=Mycobacteroides abscessus TaxID=36809 RepID=UPI001D154FFD|nr:aminodeoxychorismate lyase [Mycobacteroides abscessus]UEA49096.1 aminodeoxychorismate lyase [Mycobacteroides abscessus subsp. abscessus]UEA55098.1 aminodeoxychorismate lyase [Mycobacteroides abscessus]